MRLYTVIFCFFSFFSILGQELPIEGLDERYREDQFYASITYNLLQNKQEAISQSGFSTGFHFGFIRDMPFNKRRNLAVGLGLGLSSNSYNQNLRITKTNDGFNYSITDESVAEVSKNKFTTYLIEVPLELRWRTSRASGYRFWRIYAGFKVGYLLYNSSKFKSTLEKDKLSSIDDFDPLQYGLILSAGYGTWNFHLYYGLNPIFDTTAKFNDRSIDMRSVKIGLIFYIL